MGRHELVIVSSTHMGSVSRKGRICRFEAMPSLKSVLRHSIVHLFCILLSLIFHGLLIFYDKDIAMGVSSRKFCQRSNVSQ
mmetsp:Transcript_9008/g.33219  ORF Transcript_9008/g.33219 Transcript_9008/m.33219 type:complete len:81 (-) Transcript_9008:565-807(-)